MERSETRETAVTPSQEPVSMMPSSREQPADDGTKLVRLACPNPDDVRLARLPSCDVTSILKSSNNHPKSSDTEAVHVILCEQDEQLHYL